MSKKIAHKFMFILVIINTKLLNMKVHKFISYKYITIYERCYIANFLAHISSENYIKNVVPGPIGNPNNAQIIANAVHPNKNAIDIGIIVDINDIIK